MDQWSSQSRSTSPHHTQLLPILDRILDLLACQSGSISSHHTQLLVAGTEILPHILDQLLFQNKSTSTHHTQLLPCDLPDYSNMLGESYFFGQHLRMHVEITTDNSDLDETTQSRDASETRDVCVSGVGEVETTPNMMTDIMDRHWDMVDEVGVDNCADGEDDWE